MLHMKDANEDGRGRVRSEMGWGSATCPFDRAGTHSVAWMHAVTNFPVQLRTIEIVCAEAPAWRCVFPR